MEKYPKIPCAAPDALLAEGYRLWEAAGLPPPGPDEGDAAADAALAMYDGPHREAFAAVCRCYRLFRALHMRAEAFPEAATLLGDYFFGVFSCYMVLFDSPPLIRAFAGCLARDATAAAAGDADGPREDAMEFISIAREALPA
ncbi:MAG: hypothetical protein LBP73_04860 [Clostridiales Family XIII bacterium]|jgi:hypothetical protein|nr:hypothetical protein [Clostridiales Family XIII bacterium]